MLSAMPCNYHSQPHREVSAGQRLLGADQQSISLQQISRDSNVFVFIFKTLTNFTLSNPTHCLRLQTVPERGSTAPSAPFP